MSGKETCVLIPTYNNEQTIVQVISGVKLYIADIIVVNDGSTDSTSRLLEGMDGITVVSYPKNKGKGYALRMGLKEAAARGFRYAISIDSDGQHYASDIPLFLKKIEEIPDALLIGARNLRQDNMPGRNTFANKISNFWYRVETGKKLADTQSGYRLYPVQATQEMRYFTRRYEFEVESIVRASWKGIEVVNIPINVYYAPAGERLSHFRPFKDFIRISLLNTVLVLVAYLWVFPVRFIRQLSWKNIKKFFKEKIFATDEPKHRIAYAIGLGVFMGIVPVWGYQMMSAYFLSRVLRLNSYITLLASNISIPPFIPFILFGSYATGGWLLKGEFSASLSDISLETVGQDLLQYVFGSVVFALGSAIFAAILSYALMLLFRKKRLPSVAEVNTIE